MNQDILQENKQNIHVRVKRDIKQGRNDQTLILNDKSFQDCDHNDGCEENGEFYKRKCEFQRNRKDKEFSIKLLRCI